MKARTTLAGVCLAALGLPLTGCAGATPAPTAKADPATVVRAAADTTSKAGSSRIRTTISMTVAGKPFTLRGAGEFDYGRGLGALTLDVPPRAGLTGQLAEVVTPQAVYLRNALPNVPKDKWVRIDSRKVAGGLFAGGGNDPSTSFEMLRGAVPGVRLVGDTTISGVAVHHYQGRLDLDQAVNLASGGVRAALTAATKTLADKSIPFDAYLDDAGRLRRVDETFTLTTPGGAGASTKAVSEAELYDFGVPVTVQTPPAAQTVVGNLNG